MHGTDTKDTKTQKTQTDTKRHKKTQKDTKRHKDALLPNKAPKMYHESAPISAAFAFALATLPVAMLAFALVRFPPDPGFEPAPGLAAARF